MKIACDRCSKIIPADSKEVRNDWLRITTDTGLTYAFCEKCSMVFWKVMFEVPEKKRTVKKEDGD